MKSSVGRSSAALAMLLLSATSLFAQAPIRNRALDPAPAVLDTPRITAPNTDARMMGFGLALAVAGFLGGGFAGGSLEAQSSDDEFAGLNGFVIGAAIGEAIALPLGVHWGNYSEGKYLPSFAGSAALSALGLAIVYSDNFGDGSLLLAIPVLQLFTSMVIEKQTAARRN